MSDIEHIPVDYPAAFEEAAGSHESIRDWLVGDPSLRYRLRGALATFNIEPARSYDLGYSSRPFINMNAFCEHFDLPIDPESTKGEQVARAFMAGCIELREDVGAAFYPKGRSKPSALETFSQLPTMLQLLAAFKVIGRLEPGSILTNADRRGQIKSYFMDRLGVPDVVAEDVLQATAIVYSDKVIERTLEQGDIARANTTGVDVRTLAGPTSPEYGVHMGVDVEQAARGAVGYYMGEVLVDTLLEDELPYYIMNDESSRQRYQGFWPAVTGILDHAVKFADKPEEETDLWRGYLFGKIAFANAFMPRRATSFDGGLDQFVSREEPIADNEFKDRMEGARAWMKVADKYGLPCEGLDLARQAFAIETIDNLETEIAYNSDKKRGTRIEVIALLLSDLQATSPELAASVLERCNLIKPALIRAMNPWGYKFD